MSSSEHRCINCVGRLGICDIHHWDSPAARAADPFRPQGDDAGSGFCSVSGSSSYLRDHPGCGSTRPQHRLDLDVDGNGGRRAPSAGLHEHVAGGGGLYRGVGGCSCDYGDLRRFRICGWLGNAPRLSGAGGNRRHVHPGTPTALFETDSTLEGDNQGLREIHPDGLAILGDHPREFDRRECVAVTADCGPELVRGTRAPRAHQLVADC